MIKNIYYYVWMAIILFADRLTKMWAVSSCVQPVVVAPFFSCTLLYNRGVAWSMGSTDSYILFHLLSSFIVIVTLLLISYTYYRMQKNKNAWAACAIIAGSLSNIYDRYTVGGVIDFIDISYAGWSFPTFNIADVAIVCGALIMLIEQLQEEE